MTVVASANLGSHKDGVVLDGLLDLTLAADIINVQEGGDRQEVLDTLCHIRAWKEYHGDDEGASSTPILWNPKTLLVSRLGCRPATEPTDCGRLGAGPNVVKAKVFNHIRVIPRANLNGNHDPFVNINGHWPASLYLKCRRRLGKIMVEELADMVERRDGNIDVVATGDFNMRAGALMLRALRKQGMRQHTHFPTHGVRSIDLTWTLGRDAWAEPFKPRYSDHRWVLLHT